MDKQLKDKWIAASVSGDFEQCQNSLRNDKDQFCCLGVLCKIAGLKEIQRCDGCYGYLFKKGNELSGLSDEAMNHLVDMNDNQNASFAEIADWIKENL